jgi:hypothetical protein
LRIIYASRAKWAYHDGNKNNGISASLPYFFAFQTCRENGKRPSHKPKRETENGLRVLRQAASGKRQARQVGRQVQQAQAAANREAAAYDTKYEARSSAAQRSDSRGAPKEKKNETGVYLADGQ